MKVSWENVGIKNMAAIISEHLKKNGIEAVLVGGACVSIYSENKYTSYDIDLITTSSIKTIIPVYKNNLVRTCNCSSFAVASQSGMCVI